MLFGRAADVDEVPRRAFEQDVLSGIAHFRFSAAHHARDGADTALVGDDQHFGVERHGLAVEQRERLARARATLALAAAGDARRKRLLAAAHADALWLEEEHRLAPKPATLIVSGKEADEGAYARAKASLEGKRRMLEEGRQRMSAHDAAISELSRRSGFVRARTFGGNELTTQLVIVDQGSEPQVELHLKDRASAGVFKAGKDYQYVLMPLTVNL